ncbi:MAG: TonB family protein [Betaproteobacteria bacterium]
MVAIAAMLLCADARALTPEAIFQLAGTSIVRVASLDANGVPTKQSSGVVVKPGEVVTSCNAVSGNTNTFVVFRGVQWAFAQLAGTDEQRNLCYLQWQGNEQIGWPVKGVVPVERVRKGQVVYAVGAPKGLELEMSAGTVVGVGQHPQRGTVIRMDTPVAHAASGGGLFDREGRLIGFTAIVLKEDQILDFAVPASAVFDLVPGLRARQVVPAALSKKQQRADQENLARLQSESAGLAEARNTVAQAQARAERARVQAEEDARRAAQAKADEEARVQASADEATAQPSAEGAADEAATGLERTFARLQSLGESVDRALAGARIAAKMYSMDFSMALDAEGRVTRLVLDRGSGDENVDRTVTTRIVKAAPYRDAAQEAGDRPVELSLRVAWFYDHAGTMAIIGALPPYGVPEGRTDGTDLASSSASTPEEVALRPDVDAQRQARELAQEQLRLAAEQRQLRKDEDAQRLLREYEAARDAKREAAEADARSALAAAADAQRVVAEFGRKVMAAVSAHFFVPESARPDTRAEIAFRVMPNGTVASVRFDKRSGLSDFDRAIVQAVRQAQPLPVPADADIYAQFPEQHMVFTGEP